MHRMFSDWIQSSSVRQTQWIYDIIRSVLHSGVSLSGSTHRENSCISSNKPKNEEAKESRIMRQSIVWL